MPNNRPQTPRPQPNPTGSTKFDRTNGGHAQIPESRPQPNPTPATKNSPNPRPQPNPAQMTKKSLEPPRGE